MTLIAAIARPDTALDVLSAGTGVSVRAGVAEIPAGATVVTAGAGSTEVGAAAGGICGAEGGCAPSSGGTVRVIPTRKRVVSLNPFALIISGYLLPFP